MPTFIRTDKNKGLFRVFDNFDAGSHVKVIEYSDIETIKVFGMDDYTTNITRRQIGPANAVVGRLAKMNITVAHGDEVNASAFTYIEDMEA